MVYFDSAIVDPVNTIAFVTHLFIRMIDSIEFCVRNSELCTHTPTLFHITVHKNVSRPVDVCNNQIQTLCVFLYTKQHIVQPLGQ